MEGPQKVRKTTTGGKQMRLLLKVRTKRFLKYALVKDNKPIGTHTYNRKTRGHSLVVAETFEGDLEKLFNTSRDLVNERIDNDTGKV